MVRHNHFFSKLYYLYLRQLVAEYTKKKIILTSQMDNNNVNTYVCRETLIIQSQLDEIKINQINMLVYIFCYIGYEKNA